jgi:hypothetical protein
MSAARTTSASVMLALMAGLAAATDSSDSSDSDSVGVGVSVASAFGVGVAVPSSVSAGAVAHPARTRDEMISVLISVIFFGIVCLSLQLVYLLLTVLLYCSSKQFQGEWAGNYQLAASYLAG